MRFDGQYGRSVTQIPTDSNSHRRRARRLQTNCKSPVIRGALNSVDVYVCVRLCVPMSIHARTHPRNVDAHLFGWYIICLLPVLIYYIDVYAKSDAYVLLVGAQRQQMFRDVKSNSCGTDTANTGSHTHTQQPNVSKLCYTALHISFEGKDKWFHFPAR